MSQALVSRIMTRSGRVYLFKECNSGLFSQVLHMSKARGSGKLGQTTVILQDGLDIQELPAIVRNVKDVGMVSLSNVGYTSVDEPDFDLAVPEDHLDMDLRNEDDCQGIVDEIARCFTVKGILRLLASIPEQNKTPNVALHALQKIVELENNEQFRNRTVRSAEESKNNSYFSRSVTMNELVDTISCSPDSQFILEGLRAISKEMFEGDSTKTYRDRLCDEALIRATDGKFNIVQVCEVVKVFSTFKNISKINADIDKLWVGLVDKEAEISESNIDELFKILPLLNQSQKMLLNILEKKIVNAWWRLSGSSVADALSVLFEVKLTPSRMLGIFSRWTNTNIHTLSEDTVVQIVRGFSALEYIDKGIETALERYVKAKGLQVKNPTVLAAIMDYCAQFRFRSPHILQGCGEYFINYSNTLSPMHIKSFFIPFGLLDYSPPNGLKFWKALENVMSNKFIQFRPEDALDLMLTCVYLEKHPVNFIKKVFNPYFLDRLHSTIDHGALQLMRTKLKLFDTAMTLECPSYRGPLLPRDHSAKSLWQDGRIKRMANTIAEPLSVIAGGADMITTSVVLSQLPTTALYVIDILLHPRGMGSSMLQFNLRRDPNVYIAVLIHIPEHYCSQGKYLMGPQVMRKRHFRRLGLKVADLEYEQLARLKVHPQALNSYLIQKIRLAEKAI